MYKLKLKLYFIISYNHLFEILSAKMNKIIWVVNIYITTKDKEINLINKNINTQNKIKRI